MYKLLGRHSEGSRSFSLGPLRSEQKLPMQTCEGKSMNEGPEGFNTQESRSFGMAGSGPRVADEAGPGRGFGRHAEQCGHVVASGQPAEIKQEKDEIKDNSGNCTEDRM